MMRHIYFIRHGQTDSNQKNILMGGRADSPLTAEGQNQAQVLARGLQNIAFDRVYVSSNTRAQETAQIIFGHRQIPMISSDLIKEQDFGLMTGKSLSDIPPAIDQQFKEDPYHFAHTEGESLADLKDRVGLFLQKEIESSPFAQIAIVTHENVIKTAIGYMKSLDKEIIAFKFNYCSVNHYLLDQSSQYHAVSINYTY